MLARLRASIVFVLLSLPGCSISPVYIPLPESVFLATLVSNPELKLEGHFDVRPKTVARAFFIDLNRSTVDANVSLIFADTSSTATSSQSVTLDEHFDEEHGLFATDSVESPNLVYAAGQTYTFATRLPGTSSDRRGSVRLPAQLSDASLTLAPELQPVSAQFPNVKRHAKGRKLIIAWPVENGQHGYVTVFREVPSRPDRPEIIFDSPGHDTYLDLVYLSSDSPAASQTIPGSTFTEDGLYAVLVVTMNLQNDDFESKGWRALAGSGAAVFLAVGNSLP